MAATLTPEARELCEQYIGRLLDEWEVPLELRIAIAAGASVKTRQVTRLRDRLIWQLRRTCWQEKGMRPKSFLFDCSVDPGRPWRSLSSKNIGSLLGLTHVAVLRSIERTAETVDTAAD